ncbi:MAG TPA: histidinol phosphate phosphatase [Clostridiales bacterium]|nr:histidinol phosphate phosphatase [Clostridiales bacterium]
MEIYDSHIHSCFSTDSIMEADAACAAAVQKKLAGIQFAEHVDIDYPGHEAEFDVDFIKYLATVFRLKQQYEGRLKVGAGIETGFQPHTRKQTEAIVARHRGSLDIIIQSVHIFRHQDPYTGEIYEGKTMRQVYGTALEEILASLQAGWPFQVVGHLEYITRYFPYPDRSLRYMEFPDLYDEIFKKLIEKGRGLELNTGSLRADPGAESRFAFDRQLYTRYRECGGEIITLASDAHRTEHLGFALADAAEFLKHCGFSHYTCFMEQTPGFVKI